MKSGTATPETTFTYPRPMPGKYHWTGSVVRWPSPGILTSSFIIHHRLHDLMRSNDPCQMIGYASLRWAILPQYLKCSSVFVGLNSSTTLVVEVVHNNTNNMYTNKYAMSVLRTCFSDGLIEALTQVYPHWTTDLPVPPTLATSVRL